VAPRLLSRESKRHELDVACCVRFCSVASAAARSVLLLQLVAGPEQQSVPALCRTTTWPVVRETRSVVFAALTLARRA
jgi:hypothetical protein